MILKIRIIFLLPILWLSITADAAQSVAPISNDLYNKECGVCHMAYQPGLLPARSWKKLLNSLDEHFNENAELDDDDLQKINEYIMQNSADRSSYPVSVKIMKYLEISESPTNIMDVPYITRKHRGLENRLNKPNGKGLKNLSRCDACHTHANNGSYVASELRMPKFTK